MLLLIAVPALLYVAPSARNTVVDNAMSQQPDWLPSERIPPENLEKLKSRLLTSAELGYMPATEEKSIDGENPKDKLRLLGIFAFTDAYFAIVESNGKMHIYEAGDTIADKTVVSAVSINTMAITYADSTQKTLFLYNESL